MHGKICLVTGATSGIGRVVAHALAEQQATVVLVGRHPAKTAAAVAGIKQQTGNRNVDGLLADLSVQADVRGLAHEFNSRYPRLNVLVNNAGALIARRQLTPDGLEMTFALNHLGYFLLTQQLLGALRAGAAPGANARIVNVASGAHRRVRGLDFDDLESRRGYFGLAAYSRSKLANVLFTYELARRLQSEGAAVTANAMHPGLIATGFGRSNGPLWALAYILVDAVSLTPAQGADTAIFLATAPEVEGVSGKYFYQRRVVASSRASHDEAAARRLWDISVRLTHPAEPVEVGLSRGKAT